MTYDWNLTDTQLSRLHNKSRKTIRIIRKASGKPCPNKHLTEKGIKFKQWIDAHRHLSGKLTQSQIMKACGINLDPSKLWMKLNKYGFKFISTKKKGMSIWHPHVNWTLPNVILNEIWGGGITNLIVARKRYAPHVRPQWDCRKLRFIPRKEWPKDLLNLIASQSKIASQLRKR